MTVFNPPNHISGTAPRRVIIGLMLVILLGALDQTIIAVALPTIAAQLGGFGLMAWVVSGYLVAATVVTPIYGKLGDLYGRRAVLSTALGIFLLASILCALAPSMEILVLARVLQGIGGGGLIANAQAAIADVVPPRERGRYQGYISGAYAVASIAGPVLGGLLTEHLSWQWIFWINLPLGLLALVVCRNALPGPATGGNRRPLDYPGALLLTGGLAALMTGLARIGQGLPWHAPQTLVLIAAALALLGMCLWHLRRAAEPILPLHLFRIPTVALGCGLLFLAFFQLVSLSVLLPLRMQMMLGVSAHAAALQLITLSLAVPVGAYAGGTLASMTGRYRPVLLAGTALLPAAVLALAWLPPATGGALLAALLAAGVAIGMQFPTTLVAVQNAVPRTHVGIATALQAFFRSLGGAVGLAILSAVLMKLLHGASPDFPGGVLPDGSAAGSAQPAAAAAAVEHAFRIVLSLGAAIALPAVLLAVRMPDVLLGDRATE